MAASVLTLLKRAGWKVKRTGEYEGEYKVYELQAKDPYRKDFTGWGDRKLVIGWHQLYAFLRWVELGDPPPGRVFPPRSEDPATPYNPPNWRYR